MGNDGTNYLTIRGPPDTLNMIIETRASVPFLSNEPDYYQTLRQDYFGKATYTRKDVNCLVITYPFRNQVPEDYLKDLLLRYPDVWMKNEFDSEEGLCGIWIGHFIGDEPSIQRRIWRELGWQEEHAFGRG